MIYLKIILIVLVLFAWPGSLYAQEPVITITLSTPDTTSGHLFITPIRIGAAPVPSSLIILDNQGRHLYRKDSPDWVMDFKRLPNGLISYMDRESESYKLLNSSFQQVGQLEGVGYPVDTHDLQLSPDKERYLFIIYRRRFGVDMSQIVAGGNMSATVVSCLIQEVDRDNNLVWQWDGWDHQSVTYTNANLLGASIDYDHCNSLEYDNDGNIMVSSRNLDSITKINRATGEVIWRLGGMGNDFTFTNDSGFALQHDARWLGSGRLTLFDNGRATRGYSRAVEYEINEAARLITRTWEYTGSFAFCCGNFQTLPDGNRLINWGPAKPSVTEVTPDGERVFELTIAAPYFSYRAFKFPEPFYFPIILKQASPAGH